MKRTVWKYRWRMEGDHVEPWSNEKVEVRPTIIAEHSRWAASGAFNAPWINASQRHLPPTAFLRVKHIPIHFYHSFLVATIYAFPFSVLLIFYRIAFYFARIYNHPFLSIFSLLFYKNIILASRNWERIKYFWQTRFHSGDWLSLMREKPFQKGDASGKFYFTDVIANVTVGGFTLQMFFRIAFDTIF